MLVGSYTTVQLDSNAKLKLKNAAGWAVNKPLFSQLTSTLENFEMYGGEVDVNYDNQSVALNSGYYPIFVFSSVTNLNIHDMNLHDGAGHGLQVTSGTNLIFHSNTVKNLGGDGAVFISSNTVDVYSNTITVRGNSGIHIKNTANSLIHNNYITGIDDASGGIASILIEDTDGTTTYPEIYDNVILDSYGSGILAQETYEGYKNRHKHFRCHHNIMRGCGRSEIHDFVGGCTIQGWDGAIFEYNTFDGCYNNGIYSRYPPLGDGFSITCSNNTISNTHHHRNSEYRSSWSGHGLSNRNSTKYTVYSQNNLIFNSENGSYYGVDGTLDIPSTPSIQRYIPPTSYIQDEIPNYYIQGRTAYINGYPFRWQVKKISVSKSVGQEKPPGTDGWALDDFGFGGAEITLDCYAYSLDEMRQVISAFYRPGKSILELGGLYEGYRITGLAVKHSTDLQLTHIIPEKTYPYNIFFLADKPIMESNTKKIRTKKLTDDAQIWSSDDCYPGNIIKNHNWRTWNKKNVTMTWQTQASASDNNWTSLCWSPTLGMFAAVANTGTGNRVMTSSDGLTWTARTTPADNNWTSVCWSSALSLFIAVANSGSGNRVMTSGDGITWTIRSSAGDYDWRSVAAGSSKVVAVAGGGSYRVMYSSAGTSWTTASAALSQEWRSVCWSPSLGVFVAVSYTGTTQQVMTSSTGSSWTARTTPLSLGWTSVCWSPELGMFAAVAENGSNQQVMTSYDGASWTARYTPETRAWQSICWNPDNRCFVAVANMGTPQPANADFENWSTGTSDAAPDSWTFGVAGQSRSTDAKHGTYSYSITGNGTDSIRGQVSQTTTLTPGYWTIGAWIKATNVTSGQLNIDLNGGSPAVDTDGIRATATTNGWIYREVRAYVDSTNPLLRIFVDGTPNSGSAWYVDSVILTPDRTSGVMTSYDGINWSVIPASHYAGWKSVCWSPARSRFVAISNNGSGNRVMASSDVDVSNLHNCAPDDWDYHCGGQWQSNDCWSDINSYEIRGDGYSQRRGYCSQSIRFEEGCQYSFRTTGKVSGCSQGKMHIGIYSNDSLKYGLDYSDDCDWTDMENDECVFDVDELDGEIRIYADDYANEGAYFWCDRIVVTRSKHYDSLELGNDITTTGTVDIVPDVMVTATRLTNGAITEGFNIKSIDAGSTYEINGNVYSLLHTETLPAKSHKRHRIDRVSCRHCSDSSSYRAYTKVTYQCASLNNGAETLLCEFDSDSEYPNYEDAYNSPYITCGENESCTMRYYGRNENSGHRSHHSDCCYCYLRIA